MKWEKSWMRKKESSALRVLWCKEAASLLAGFWLKMQYKRLQHALKNYSSWFDCEAVKFHCFRLSECSKLRCSCFFSSSFFRLSKNWERAYFIDGCSFGCSTCRRSPPQSSGASKIDRVEQRKNHVINCNRSRFSSTLHGDVYCRYLFSQSLWAFTLKYIDSETIHIHNTEIIARRHSMTSIRCWKYIYIEKALLTWTSLPTETADEHFPVTKEQFLLKLWIFKSNFSSWTSSDAIKP